MTLQHIQYLHHQQIDKKRWDSCIDTAANGRIYGYSTYLDHMSDHWDGLVLNDYEAVMPLTWRKKFGISYLYQPPLVAQAGVFGKELTTDLVKNFLDAVPKKFRLWEFPLNSGNAIGSEDDGFYMRKNYVLALHHQYEALNKNYRDNIRRNIKKSLQYGNTATPGITIDAVKQLALSFNTGISKEALERFSNLYSVLQKSGNAKSYGIVSLQSELLASAVFVFSHNRAYYILVGNHPNGRTLGASHALIDAFIADHAGEQLLLDVEGSDIRNLAFFYSSFGAVEENYPAVKRNLLPFYLRWLKS